MMTDLLPTPPRTSRGEIRRAAPMTVEEARRIVDAYNRWAKVWNRHELDHSLPRNPRSEEGDIFWHGHAPDALGWQDYETGRRCVIRVEGFCGFDQRTGLRQTVDPGKIVWAGWLPGHERASKGEG